MPEYLRPRRLSTVGEVCDAAVSLVTDAGWSEADVTRVALVLGEAVSNSVEHGAGDEVALRLDLVGDALHVRVADDGPGPDAARLDRAHLPDDPLSTEGRGLFILRRLADAVEADSSGALRLTIRARP
ncbi:ATP-binding protein [Rubrivirga sp.]|uniref:ATP-binding protein n=1 Tax=Rubrivirga sp. TaxID=1885344 RepID=UPI003B516645